MVTSWEKGEVGCTVGPADSLTMMILIRGMGGGEQKGGCQLPEQKYLSTFVQLTSTLQ